ncbi:MAG TPA: hypothetical protein VFH73_23255 [Polyangia bacterium]|jgi:hypothetical protein|nr:hypothetical protein [Polyangia bacterium]
MTTFNHAALAAAFEALGKPARPGDSRQAKMVAIAKDVIERRRHLCYGGLVISDEQTDELARAIVTNLALVE